MRSSMPSTSWNTSTWPSHCGPAPMPMVGTSTALGDHAGHLVGHALEHDGEAPGVGQRLGVGHEPQRGLLLAALHLEAAHGVHRLRGEAEVAHHRDLGVDERLDHRQALAPALELHGLGSGPDQLGRVAHGVARRTRGSSSTAGRRRSARRAWPGPPPRCGGPCRPPSPAACRRSRAPPWPGSRRRGSCRPRPRRPCGPRARRRRSPSRAGRIRGGPSSRAPREP